LAGYTDLQQHLAIGRTFANEMAEIVGAVKQVVFVNMQAVGARELPLSPGAQEVAVTIEHDHRMFAAIKYVDLVLAVDGDRRDVLEFPAVGQFCPVFDYLISVFASAQNCCHCAAPLCLI
jgi:hypothetical protein